jgi:hypothetical protein
MNASPMPDQVDNAPLADCHRPDSSELALITRTRQSRPAGLLYPCNCGQGRERQGREYGEPFLMQTECVLQSYGDTASLEVSLRFLQTLRREVFANAVELHRIPALADLERPRMLGSPTGNGFLQTSRETIEREVRLPSVWLRAGRHSCFQRAFEFPVARKIELLADDQGDVAGAIVHRQHSLKGMVELKSRPAGLGALKIRVRILNQTTLPDPAFLDPDAVILRTFASTHAILRAQAGCFLSPQEVGMGCCVNIGTRPVLVGGPGQRQGNTIISSPGFASGKPASSRLSWSRALESEP